MGMIEDVMKALDRIPVWKRVSGLPAEVENIEKRLKAIEGRLAGTAGEECPLCASPTFMRVSSVPDPTFGDMGILSDKFECSACKHSEQRQRDPSGRSRR